MSDKPSNLAAALAKVQAELPEVERDRTVTVEPKDPKKPPYSYSYVTLANLSGAILPLLAKHGLSFAAMPGAGGDGKMCVRYQLMHESGETLSGEFPISGEGGIQMIGGRITYARRYCLAAIVGVAADEDDESRLSEDGPRGTAQRAATRQPRQRSDPAGDRGATAQRAAQRSSRAQPPLPGEDEADGKVTTPQMRKMHALFNQVEWTERDDRLMASSAIVGRTIHSANDLTLDEAKALIDALERVAAGPDPADRLGKLVTETMASDTDAGAGIPEGRPE